MSSSKEMLDAIMRAMEMEKETFDFYTAAEAKTFNPKGKKIFHWLAKTEEEHYLKLSELYSSLDNSGRWVFYAGSTITLAQGEEGPSFETDDLQALEVAMSVERSGIEYFEELVTKTADADGKKMLETLIAEEREHLRIITEKYRELKGA